MGWSIKPKGVYVDTGCKLGAIWGQGLIDPGYDLFATAARGQLPGLYPSIKLQDFYRFLGPHINSCGGSGAAPGPLPVCSLHWRTLTVAAASVNVRRHMYSFMGPHINSCGGSGTAPGPHRPHYKPIIGSPHYKLA